MIQAQEYIQLKAFARQDGTILGILWVLGFACFVGSAGEPMLTMGFQMSLFFTPFVVFWCTARYRDRIIGGLISYRRALGYSLLMFLYASLVLALAQWIYFEFIDNGRLVGGMISAVNNPLMEPMLKQYGFTKDELLVQLNQLAEMRPIDFSFSFLMMNFCFGGILSMVIALLSVRSRKVRIKK